MASVPIDIRCMDFSVSPRTSFFRYVNGGWLARTQIPNDKTAWGSFYELREKAQEDLKTIFDDALKKDGLIGEMYSSALDLETIELAQLNPIDDIITSIDQLINLQGFIRLSASLIKEQQAVSVISIMVMPDLSNSEMNSLGVFQSDFGLPSKDYYFDESKKEYLGKYQAHIKNVYVLLGDEENEAQVKAQQIIDFETKLAEIAWTPTQLRDIEKMNNPMTVGEFDSLVPNLYPMEFFKTIGLTSDSHIFIQDKDFFQKLGQLLQDTPLDTLKTYLKYKVVHAFSPYLTQALEKEHFEFQKKGLRGQPTMEPRWKTVIEHISPLLEDLIGEEYVSQSFSLDSKKACQEMVQYIQEEFGERIRGLKWMSEETKKKALLKLSTFQSKIGYPDKWRNYDLLKGLIRKSNAYCTNIRLGKSHEFIVQLGEYGKPVDKEKWGMPPFLVNAYYNPQGNEIAFPAAILQPPFFYGASPEAPSGFPALNFGGIGAVISHEISHGFDDQGSLFDEKGNMVNWWLESDKEEFKKRCGKIVDQFNQYRVHGLPVNGSLCQGENIADLGGASISYKAFLKFKKEHPEKCIDHPKFSQEQQFFISYGSIWRSKYRKDFAINLLSIDPHSPSEFRTDGPLSNMPEFHEAFGVREGDRMFNPVESRVEIW